MAAQTTLSVGVLEGVVRMLEGLVPEETGFASMQAGLVLQASVVLSVGGVTLWKHRGEMEWSEINKAKIEKSGACALRNRTCVKMEIKSLARTCKNKTHTHTQPDM